MRSVLLALVVALAVAPAAAAPRTAKALDVRPESLTGARPHRAAAGVVSWRGGHVRTATGEDVVVYASASYPEGTVDPQHWADVFVGFLHGRELGALVAYVAKPAEVSQLCLSDNALGCFDGTAVVVPGEDADGVSATSVAAHEYGHLIAEFRSNAPWLALHLGFKRWASAADVCARERAGTAFPGDEGAEYALNPGEAFAETYRVLVGQGPDVWSVIAPSFRPSEALLAAAREDVVHPWTAPTRIVARGAFRPGGARSWTLPLALPLDGDLVVDLSMPVGAGNSIELVGARGKIVARGAWSGAGARQLVTQVCGLRAARLVVRRAAPVGTFVVRIRRP